MPELPEVERVRQSLVTHLRGRQVVAVAVGEHRDVIRGDDSAAALLQGMILQTVTRHGKQLALLAGHDGAHMPPPERDNEALLSATRHVPPRPKVDAQPPRAVCIHLGMSGSLQWQPPPGPDNAQSRRTIASAHQADTRNHRHLIWTLDDDSHLVFRDPRRFGGIWTFNTPAELASSRWAALGPDALAITPSQLRRGLRRTTRALKAALLDQNLIAGLGNIYVDELLFRARLSPLMPANELAAADVTRLVGMMRRLLAAAVEAGGSTLRDYVDGNGAQGGFQHRHRVYGRAGLPCKRCRATLVSAAVAGRTTVWCEVCQPTEASWQAFLSEEQ